MGGREYKKQITLREGGDEVTVDLDNLNDGELLKRDGDQIVTVPTPTGTVPAGSAIGDALVWNGVAWILLPAGPAGYVITSNGPGTLPTYQKIAAPKAGDTVVASLEYIGQGETGPTKTTTVFDGPTIAEQFRQLGDTLYTNWLLPGNLDNTQDVTVRVHFYLSDDADPIAPGTAVSFQAQIGASDGTPLNAIVGTEVQQDVLVSGTWLDAHAEFTLDAATYLQFAGQDALNLRITRIANSGGVTEPSDGPRVHLIELDYIAG
jgi:hypothetical protein